MAYPSPHRDWRLDLISPVDVRAAGLDQVLTRLWLRILHDNKPLVARPGAAQRVVELANQLERPRNDAFRGFAEHRGVAETWLRADLLKTLRRKPERFTVARPLHAEATRVRSIDKETDDSQVSVLVYAWLTAVDRPLLKELKRFLSVNPAEEQVDLATFALALLGADQDADTPKVDQPADVPRPICLGQAKIFADDVRRLLAYREAMPRSVLVDHLRRLTGFHVGLYLLRVFRIAVELESAGPGRRCETCGKGRAPRQFTCPHRLELLVDFGEDARSPVARLAERAWSVQEDYLARYVRSHLALKKLHEFAEDIARSRPTEAPPCDTIEQIAAVEDDVREELLDLYFEQRVEDLARTVEAKDKDAAARIRELSEDYRRLGLSPFRRYVAILAHSSERRWVNYHRYLLDSLFAKNTADGLVRQPLGGRRRRRAAMGAGLLETLALIAVVDGTAGAYFTRPVRVDEFIGRLEDRYDLLITRPPAELADDLEATRALAANVERFKGRLRETGLFTDLSDAFLAQLVRPRYHLSTAA